jgi:hypothetical protein
LPQKQISEKQGHREGDNKNVNKTKYDEIIF